jgi:hypothetical protein
VWPPNDAAPGWREVVSLHAAAQRLFLGTRLQPACSASTAERSGPNFPRPSATIRAIAGTPDELVAGHLGRTLPARRGRADAGPARGWMLGPCC